MAVYGIKWHSDATSPTLDRLESNVGLTAGTPFNTLSPWTMRRCNLWDDGTVTAYYGDRCYTDTDVANMGQCMVQIPKFWYSVDTTLANHVGFYISNTGTETVANLSGAGNITWAVHPAFTSDSNTKSYAYVGAYEGSYNSTTAKLESRASGAAPTVSQTLPTFRGYAQARGGSGATWNIFTIQQLAALQLLFIVEYASLDSQSILGRGFDGAYGVTGLTAASGNASYGVNSDGTHTMSYRGVENLWGNYRNLIDGVNYSVVAGAQHAWIADHSFQSDIVTPPYDIDAGALSDYSTAGYGNGFLLPSNAKWAFLPGGTPGSGNQHYYACDYFATNKTAGSLAILQHGGGSGDGGLVTGLFWQNSGYASSYAGSSINGRLSCIPPA